VASVFFRAVPMLNGTNCPFWHMNAISHRLSVALIRFRAPFDYGTYPQKDTVYTRSGDHTEMSQLIASGLNSSNSSPDTEIRFLPAALAR
jgi:hypothetical protein